MNKVILIGRLTSDPEVRQTQNGKNTCSFNVAVDRNNGKDKEKTADFIRCVAWGSNADFISKYFSKGKMIAIEGNIKTGSYEKDGAKHYTTDVWVDRAEFAGDKSAPTSKPQTTTSTAKEADFEEIISDEDAPF